MDLLTRALKACIPAMGAPKLEGREPLPASPGPGLCHRTHTARNTHTYGGPSGSLQMEHFPGVLHSS